MTITISTPSEKKILSFDSVEELDTFNQKIKSALIDEKNTMIATYAKDNINYVFPAQVLKNSLIEIKYDEPTGPFFF